MVFHLVNSDYRMTGTVAFQFKTFQRRQSERREWSLHLIPIGHLGLFLRVEWVGILTDQFTMELFETLVLIISPITKLCSRVGLNSFPKQVPWSNSIKTLIQSSRKPQNGYQIVSNHVIVFTHMKVYIWGEYNPHKICLYTTDSCFIVLCAYMARGGGGEERVERFFFMWKQLLLFFIDPPTGEGYRPSSDSAVPYLLPTQPFFVLSRNAPRHCERTQKNSWLQNHRTWVKKGIWTIVFVGLSLVTYWNSLCPRLEKWKLCR